MLEKNACDANHSPPDVVFDEGLDTVLDGLAAQLGC